MPTVAELEADIQRAKIQIWEITVQSLDPGLSEDRRSVIRVMELAARERIKDKLSVLKSLRDRASLVEKLEKARAERDKWLKVAAHPALSLKAASWAANIARSYAAELKLREKALQWWDANNSDGQNLKHLDG